MSKFKSHWNEKWAVVPLESGALRKQYAVSTYGRVVSFHEKIEDGKIIKGTVTGGYPTLNLKPTGRFLTLYIHRLVAEAFLEKPNDNYRFVIHLDYNKANNKVTNLKWATKEDLETHQTTNPHIIESRRKRLERPGYKGHKLTPAKVRLLKKMIFDPNRKTRYRMIAKQFGISEMQLYRIKSGENWGHITDY
jgi:hypothetical protein